jgi:phage antirepressor YoqD-like protein
MSNLTKLFNYEGNEVTFRNHEGVVYVNATEMAKSFGKTAKDWLRTNQSEEFISSLSAVRQISLSEMVFVKKGGNDQGTWMHEDVAIEFSRWLSPAFSIWCNDRIKELMTVGMTATPETLENMLTNPDLLIGLATQLKEERSQKEKVQKQLETVNLQLTKQQPTVDYVREVLSSESTHTIKQIASELGLTAQKLNIILAKHKVQYKVRETWILYAKYIGNGYTQSTTVTIETKSHGIQTKMNTVWTEKGRAFIHRLVNPVMVASINKRTLALHPLN